MNLDELQALAGRSTVEPRVGTPRLLWRAFVLPFRHPLSLMASIILPLTGIFLLGYFFPGKTIAGGTRSMVAVELLFPLSIASQRTPLAFAIWVCSFLLLSFLLCAWQLSVVQRFSGTPAERLRATLSRVFSYSGALFFWLAASLGAYMLPLVLIGYGSAAANFGMDADPAIYLLQFVSRLGTMLLGFWVMGRLSPMPALVAAQGWRGAFPEAWRKTQRRDLGLALGGAGFLFVALFAGFALGGMEAAWIHVALARVVMGASNLVCTVMALVWFASVGALMAQDTAGDERLAQIFA